MPSAKTHSCKVLEVSAIAGTILRIRFSTEKRFAFEPGQFVSLVIPKSLRNEKELKRCYSLASSPQLAKDGVYEICVKLVPGGVGSFFIARLRAGEEFKIRAPFGDFVYETPEPGRSVCFIATGTGVAPFRSMVLSEQFTENRPKHAFAILGARKENELVYDEDFKRAGVETICAVSMSSGNWSGYKGRVTDYLRTLPRDWHWHSTDFYLCGNGDMVKEVGDILREGHGVKSSAVHQELFSAAKPKLVTLEESSKAKTEEKPSGLLRLPFFRPA